MPRPSTPRRSVLAAGLALGAAALAGCSTGPTESAGATGTAEQRRTTTSGAEAGAFPVSIEHAYGTTRVSEEPTRVVTLGWSDHDVAAALGVVPVGAVSITWGGNEQESTPWFDERVAELDAEPPTRYSDADGAPIDEIAALAPDLVLATASGLTEQEYRQLSRLAPVVAFPDDPWTTSWEDSLEMVGDALGRPQAAERLEQETEQALDDAAAEHPELAGTSFVFAALSATDTSKIDYYTPEDNRTRLLTELGMVDAPMIEQISQDGQFYGTLSAERAPDLRSDVLISYAEKPSDLEVWRDDPLLGRIPALAAGRVLASTDQTDALGMSAPSPLSIPYALEHFVPDVARAVAGR